MRTFARMAASWTSRPMLASGCPGRYHCRIPLAGLGGNGECGLRYLRSLCCSRCRPRRRPLLSAARHMRRIGTGSTKPRARPPLTRCTSIGRTITSRIDQEAAPPTGVWQGPPPAADNAALAAAVDALREDEAARHAEDRMRDEVDRARASVGMGSGPYTR